MGSPLGARSSPLSGHHQLLDLMTWLLLPGTLFAIDLTGWLFQCRPRCRPSQVVGSLLAAGHHPVAGQQLLDKPQSAPSALLKPCICADWFNLDHMWIDPFLQTLEGCLPWWTRMALVHGKKWLRRHIAFAILRVTVGCLWSCLDSICLKA
jgi:hypothetical protein